MDWVKIKSFDNLYQAEFIKEILNEQGIQAVIVNNRDSLFLIGDIDLYVPEKDEKKAQAIIDEFYGLTKINSFVMEKPIRNYQKFIEDKGINTIFKVREDPRFPLKNFEIYVKNEDLEKVKPYLDPKNIDNWETVSICHHVRQTRNRILILEEYDIDTMVLKRKDADYKLQEIYLLVPKADYTSAKQILTELKGWEKIAEFDTRQAAEIREELLSNKGIPTIIRQIGGIFELYTPQQNAPEAKNILAIHKKWVKLRTYNSIIDAQADQTLLIANGIDATIVSLKDPIFLIGGYDLYVDEEDAQKAIKILSEKEAE